jgi:hypothetical protein
MTIQMLFRGKNNETATEMAMGGRRLLLGHPVKVARKRMTKAPAF